MLQRRYFFIVSMLLIAFLPAAVNAADGGRVHIIPLPVMLKEYPGSFRLKPGIAVVTNSSDKDLAETAEWLRAELRSLTGTDIRTGSKSSYHISLNLIAGGANKLGREGYHLTVSKNGIVVEANSAAGLFYGLQSLIQLIPIQEKSGNEFSLPCVEITDYPRFGWRGLMLDVSRHFFTKQEVKKYIDEMTRYKFNILHLHLSDDQGWRIEIKSLPQLTSVGAWRVRRTGRWGDFLPALANEPTPDGGFYTQDDMREIIDYARRHFITILPEIDVPAHSLALIASFPGLSCTRLQYSVNAGFPDPVRVDNALCIGNDSSFIMLDKIFTELAALFPYEYIHIGGDEAYKGFWADCPKCKKRMDEEHLKNVEELQSYFVKRIEKILKSKGKKMIGWDEILEGGLAPEATVMSWRGMAGGIQAAKMKHHVIMTPWDFCYLDLYQGDPSSEPPTYGLCRLSDSYNYDPVPDSVDEQMILGGQGNLWTESVANFRHVEYMTWPRGMALAEVYWSPKSLRNWDDFTARMGYEFEKLDVLGIKYARSAYNAVFTPVRRGDDFAVKLSTEVKGLDIYYTFDYTNPDDHYTKYPGEPIVFPIGSSQLNVITYKDGKPIGKQINIKKEDLANRLLEGKHEY